MQETNNSYDAKGGNSYYTSTKQMQHEQIPKKKIMSFSCNVRTRIKIMKRNF